MRHSFAMRHCLLAVLLVGACTSNPGGGAAIGDPCGGSNGACAADGVCDYEGGGVCIDKTGDLDNDGIPNELDHCPHTAGGAYDEDNDGLGDECDKCPVAPPPATPDPDGDDVDSPCDPDPMTPGDEILFFDGFGSSALNSKWTAASGTWTPEGGELVVANDTTSAQELDVFVAASPNIAIETAYRIDAIGSAGSLHEVTVVGSDNRPAGVAAFTCGVETVADTDYVELETNLGAGNVLALNPAFSTAELYEAAAYAANANVGCSVVGDNMPINATQQLITPASLDSVGLGVRSIDARFEWVLVVGRQNQ